MVGRNYPESMFDEIDEQQITRCDYIQPSDPNYKLTIIDGSKLPELKNLSNPKQNYEM